MLYSDWLSHVLAFLIIGAVYYGMIQFGASVSVMLEELTGNVYVSLLWFSTYIVLSAAVVIPLICGVFNFEVCAIDRGKARISDMFYAFDSLESLFRSYRMTFYAFFKSKRVGFSPSYAFSKVHGRASFLPERINKWYISISLADTT